MSRIARTILAMMVLSAAVHSAATPTRAAESPTPQQAIEDVQPKMVKLFGAGGLKNLTGYGTGFFVSPDGHIVTIWSSLLDKDVVSVVLHDGRRFFGKVIGADPKRDLAVLKIDANNLPYIDLNSAGTAGPGALVLAFSNMFKVAVGDEPVSVQRGVISARTDLSARRGRFQIPYSGPVYVLDAVTNNPGSAGGLLTTIEGRPLAMLGREVKSSDSNTWLNYAMPLGELRAVIEDIIAGRFRRDDPLASNQSSSGTFSPTDFGIVLVPDVVYRTPAYIQTVVENSAAAKAGLKPDDLIVFANGDLVPSIRALDSVLNGLVSGDDLTLVIRRDDELVTVTFRVPRKE